MDSSATLLARLCSLRGYVYHLTAQSNIARIKRTMMLESPERLYIAARADVDELRQPRRGGKPLVIAGETVQLRDQDPLNLERLNVAPPWSQEDWCLHVNRHVFFWPGNIDRPIDLGMNHFKRYRNTAVAVLKVPTSDLLRLNLNHLRLCTVNSGQTKARVATGTRRGPDTYRPADQFEGGASKVKEIVFRDHAQLPDSMKIVSYDLIVAT